MNQLFEVSTTAIIHRPDGRMLITRRSMTKKRWPGLWTVPGGHVEVNDYKQFSPNADGVWYNVLQSAVNREVMEEVGLVIKNITYLTDMVLDEGKVFVVSLVADYHSGEVILDPNEAVAFAWVTAEEAEAYKLIAGILEELQLAQNNFRHMQPESVHLING